MRTFGEWKRDGMRRHGGQRHGNVILGVGTGEWARGKTNTGCHGWDGLLGSWRRACVVAWQGFGRDGGGILGG